MRPTQLERTITLPMAISIVIGTIIGSGIFMRPAEMASLLGSPWIILLAWIVGGLLTMLSVMVMAEIAAMLPEEGGNYAFMKHMYGDFWAYLYGWAAFAVINGAGTAGIAFIVAQYTEYFVVLPKFSPAIEQAWKLHVPMVGDFFPLENFGVKSLTVIILTIFSWICYRSTRWSGKVQNVFTIAKIAAIVLLAGGLFFSKEGTASHFFKTSSIIHPEGFAFILAFVAACNGALQAYDGCNNLLYVTGEIKDPGRTIPRSLFVGMLACIAIYLAINLAMMYVLPIDVMAGSALVASDAATVAFGKIGGGVIALLIILSVLGTTNSSVLTPPRMTRAMAKDGLFFRTAEKIHPVFKTPGNAILIHWVLMSVLVFSGSFYILTDMYIFIVWVFNLMLMLGIFILRKRMPLKERPYRVWGYPWMPVLVILVNLAYLVLTVSDDVSDYLDGKTKVMNSVFGLVATAAGIPLYYYFRYRYGKKNDSVEG